MIININDRVGVVLTKKGAEIASRNHAVRSDFRPNEYCEFQLWELMRDFGQYVDCGYGPYFKDNAIFVNIRD